MTGHHSDGGSPPVKMPPPGLLAALSQDNEPAAEQKAEMVIPKPAMDPNYSEPAPIEEFRERIRHMPVSADACALMVEMANRIEALESALVPFTTHAVMIANARINLLASGKNEPAGGTWVSRGETIKVMPNENIFYKATDTYGRGKAEANMQKIFQLMQEAAVAQTERDTHLDAGGTTH